MLHQAAASERGKRFLIMILKNYRWELHRRLFDCLCKSACTYFSKNILLGMAHWRASKPHIRYSQCHDLADSDMDDASYEWSVPWTRTGTRATAGTSMPTSSRTRTSGMQAIRPSPETNIFLPSYKAGVFVFSLLSMPFFHPPSCWPIPSRCFDMTVYLSVKISLFSHANCMKNFTWSNLTIVLLRRTIFWSGRR